MSAQYNLKIGKEYVQRVNVAADGSPRPVVGAHWAWAAKYSEGDARRWCNLIVGAKRVRIHNGPRCEECGGTTRSQSYGVVCVACATITRKAP